VAFENLLRMALVTQGCEDHPRAKDKLISHSSHILASSLSIVENEGNCEEMFKILRMKPKLTDSIRKSACYLKRQNLDSEKRCGIEQEVIVVVIRCSGYA
jgi:hypothetical protein